MTLFNETKNIPSQASSVIYHILQDKPDNTPIPIELVLMIKKMMLLYHLVGRPCVVKIASVHFASMACILTSKGRMVPTSRLMIVRSMAKKILSTRPIKRRAATTVSYLRVRMVLQY